MERDLSPIIDAIVTAQLRAGLLMRPGELKEDVLAKLYSALEDVRTAREPKQSDAP